VLDDLDTVQVRDVYAAGAKVVSNGNMTQVESPVVSGALNEKVMHSFHTGKLTAECFHLEEKSEKCRVIQVIPGQLVTDEVHLPINWAEGNGVDTNNDVLKLAVIERHKNTGHIGLGFIRGIGLKRGAIASSVSHDSHNIIVIGTNETDMALAANHICEVGGNVVVADGEVIAQMPLPIAGLMSLHSGEEVARENESVRNAVHTLGVNEGIEPFMNMAFVSLTVIPSLKMSTQGLVDVNRMERVDLYV
jgi:adenine deaminase